MKKQRENEKKKIQEAIYLSKKEEVKQAKFLTSQNIQKKNQFYGHLDRENQMRKNIVR